MSEMEHRINRFVANRRRMADALGGTQRPLTPDDDKLISSGKLPQRMPLKPLLYAHYRQFIREIWPLVEQGRTSNPEVAGLYFPDNIKKISDYTWLLDPNIKLPERKALLAQRRPFTQLELAERFRPLDGKSKIEEIRKLITISFKTYVLDWEIKKWEAGEARLSASRKVVNLPAQCYQLLVKETTNHWMVINQAHQVPVGVLDEIKRKFWNCGRITNLIGEAISAGTGACLHLGRNAPEAIAQLCHVHGSSFEAVLNLFLSSLNRNDDPESAFESATDSFIGRGHVQHVRKRMRSEFENTGNTSMDAVIVGCPIIGTPALGGLLNWINQISSLECLTTPPS